MTKPFDPTKPYCRRDKEPAIIVHTFENGKFLVVSGYRHYIVLPDGTEYGTAWESRFDLINIPEKIEGWIVFFKNGSISSVLSEEDKDRYLRGDLGGMKLACIPVSFTEGEGLE